MRLLITKRGLATLVILGELAWRNDTSSEWLPKALQSIMSRRAPGSDIISHSHMVLRPPSGCPFVVACAGHGANRNSRPARAFRRLCRIRGHRDSRIWAARCCADHRIILDIRRRSRISPAFFAGPTSVNRRFCGIGPRSVLRRARRSLSPASSAERRIFGHHLI